MKTLLQQYQLHITLGTLASVIIFFVGFGYNSAVLVGRLDSAEGKCEKNELRLDELEDLSHEQDIIQAQILTKLASIETNIAEIKESLRNNNGL